MRLRRRLFVAGALVGGLGWGAAGVLLFPEVGVTYKVFIAFVLGGMAVGAAAVMSPVLEAYYAFLLPLVTPVVVQLLSGDGIELTMGIMFTLCTGMFLRSARDMHRSMTESIRLRFENLDLLERVASANRSLQSEVAVRNRAEAQVRASLHEKEVLLTEIHQL